MENELTFTQLYYYNLLDDNGKNIFLQNSDKQSMVNAYINPMNDQQKEYFNNNAIGYMWSIVNDKVKWYYINLSTSTRPSILNYTKGVIDIQADLFWNNTSEDEKSYFGLLDNNNKYLLSNYSREQIRNIATDYYTKIREQQQANEQEMLRRAEEDKIMARIQILNFIPGFDQQYINTLEDKTYDIKDEDQDTTVNIINVNPDLIGTNDRLTQFETALLVGKRAKMLDQNAIPTVNHGDLFNSVEIALLELKSKRMPLNLERKTKNGVIISKNPNKMVLPEDIFNTDYILTDIEKEQIIQKREQEFETGVKPNIDPRKIAYSELISGLLNIDGYIPEGWNIDKLSNIEVDQIIDQRIKQLDNGEQPTINIKYNIPNRNIAHQELAEGLLPITQFQRKNNRIVNPNLMLLQDINSRQDGVLTNDELLTLDLKLPIYANQPINIDANIIRNGTVYNINGWTYPHTVTDIKQVLSWFDVDDIINERTKQLSVGNKSYIPPRDLAIMELKYGLTPGVIEKNKELIQLSQVHVI